MTRFVKTLLFFLIPLMADADIPFEDCGSVYHLESIEVSGCMRYPCHLKIGSQVKVTTNLLVQGTALNLDKDLIQDVYFVVSTIQVKAMVAPDPCTAVRGSTRRSCSLQHGDRVKYQAVISVGNVPPLPAKLYWTIKNRVTNQLVVCYKITVLLTAGHP